MKHAPSRIIRRKLHAAAIRPGSVALIVLAVLLSSIGYIWFTRTRLPVHVHDTVINFTPATTTASATQLAPAAQSYFDLVKSEHADFAATQPLVLPLDRLADAARIVLNEGVYLDPPGELWIIRPDAPAIAKILRQLADEALRSQSSRAKLHQPSLDTQTHLTRDHVVFAYQTLDELGAPQRHVIVRRTDGTLELVSLDGRMELGTPGRNYCWNRAMWIPRERDSAIVVPTDCGISILRPQSRPVELYQPLIDAPPATAPTTATSQPAIPRTQYLLDPRGLLAWIPWEDGQRGSNGAARFVDGKWTSLNDSNGQTVGWPTRIIQLVPLLDGSVLQLSLDDDLKTVKLTTGLLDSTIPAGVEEAKITQLVASLSDADAQTRETAHAELSRYGPKAWPILEKLQKSQPPEGRVRIEQLLRARSAPMLGRMVLEPGELRVVARFLDGGALIWSEAGVEIPGPDPSQPPTVIAPAWISIRGDRPIELAPPALVADLDPRRARVSGFSDEWIINDPALGPLRFFGNELEPLLRKSERATFKRLLGTDARGRWIFDTADPSRPCDAPLAGPTLIIDPTLPDITPRLPAWQYPVQHGVVGWTQAGWPVVKAGGAWVIDRDGTRPLNPKTEKMYTDMKDMPAPMARAMVAKLLATQPASQPVSQPASQPASQLATTQTSSAQSATAPSVLDMIGIDSDGGRYFDGKTSLRRIAPDGRDSTWPLPPQAIGSWENPRLIEAEGRLFLFNEPGRVLRLRRNPRDDSYSIDATFVRNIPNIDDAIRIWKDPAGRIVIAHGGNNLTILFPSGRIPNSIAERMLAGDLKANEPE